MNRLVLFYNLVGHNFFKLNSKLAVNESINGGLIDSLVALCHFNY